jgi:hypothetical protein
MKKKVLVAFTAILVFALTAVVFAYNQSQNQEMSASHCEMMKKQQNGSTVAADSRNDAEHKDSCCGMADCCKDGKCSMGGSCCAAKKDKDSCPMMKQKDAQTSASIDMTNVTVVGDTEGASCCQPGADCCTKGGSCCHKKKS